MLIVNAAIFKSGDIYEGRRHYLIIRAYPFGFFRNCIQGFITDEGKFVNREEAAKIAFENGQIDKPKKYLFSEDVW